MDLDDGIRSAIGVVACIRKLPDGKIRLIFDDVKSDQLEKPNIWTHDWFYTMNSYDEDRFIKGKLTEKELSEIGFNLIIRLNALNKFE
jgi:hypothetical protein